MDFSLTDDQRQLQEAARKFAQKELPRLADEVDETGHPVSAEWLSRYAELGFLGVNAAEDYGGLGLPHLDAYLVMEEFAKISVGVAFPVFECLAGPVRIVEALGHPDLARRVVPQAVEGKMLVAISMSEPDAGTALTDLRTTARFDGDEIVLNGTKRWCSGAGHSQGYVVFCRFDEIAGAKGIGAVFVDKETPGVSFGSQEKLMGFRGVPSADITLEEVRVPREHLIVAAGGFPKLMGLFNLERLGNATMALGVAAGALEQVTAYIQERRQFGRPLVDFQAVQLRLAEMAIKVEAARLMIHRAAATAGRGLPQSNEAAMAKCMANEITREVTTAAMQLMGGYGYVREYGMERRVRDSFGWGIAGGSIDIQKVNIAAGLVGRRFNQRG
ncbi:acyl-CoA dehydrogenase family protein [Rhizobium sp. SSA_523]|uniref:acyl-CoA dehydrogenase family protein n=1 Tax=Rhizobium sp. SSA_523 TaxID=2952477 RepID=UPI0020901C44|nr:acyl-CoA dehydrogenase family protein [Rhizobium sp. SSA_523]MCO5731644.1 acyl-CoA dehydrogenase family protein [Rhizobium sp. SSA_523]WKC21850.1 acyl-CoA dehydrogenase family protein [Rhizobium sp. SSA_523]